MHGINMEKTTGKILLDHGGGGRHTHSLIGSVFAGAFGMDSPLTDSAIGECKGSMFAFTTDSYVVRPAFFPGGNTGKLAVCGTVNDLAVSGAIPLALAAAFIIEEGFPVSSLQEIVNTMASEAARAGVRIITGDTKVVEKGKCDGIYITTSGIGFIDPRLSHTGRAERVRPGDRIIVSGPVGNHSLAILSARKELNFSTELFSDAASLNGMIKRLTDNIEGVHFMRDATRGGLAGVVNELSSITGLNVLIDENAVPVDEEVKGICEVLGFDPLYLANEGKAVIVVSAGEAEEALSVIRSEEPGRRAAIIGEIGKERKTIVSMRTIAGGNRILDVPSGSLIPRIC